MGKKMLNPPIFYTVGQIRFNPVLNMGDFVPKIHERLRKRFPEVRQEELRRVQMNFAAQDGKDAVNTFAAPRWSFANLLRTSGYALTTDSLVFHTTAYETSDEFYEALLSGIRLLDEAVGLSYIEGVGLRTLDAVVPSGGRPIAFYLNNQVLGLYGLLSGEIKHNITENVTIFPTGQQVSRVVIAIGPLGTPVDLFPIQLTIGKRFQEVNGIHAVLDLDHNRQDRFEFNLSEIEERVRQVKAGVTDVFYKVTTTEARDAWDSL
jgi:uncharacterized protein (TIGR04255 family)